MEGLEITIVKLSEIRSESIKLRIDSGYFSKAMLLADKKIRANKMGYVELGRLFSRFSKGIFDINSDAYSEIGVPFLRIQNLKNGRIEDSSIAYIPEEIHQEEVKTELKRGDIVLSKTAYPAASLVTIERCNTSQDTIATTLSEFGKEKYRPEVIVTYLNSEIGQRLLWRQFQGNIQLHLSLDDGRKVPIPNFGVPLQNKICESFHSANAAYIAANEKYAQAESLLLKALGMSNFVPSNESVNTKSFKDSFARSGRLDAEHYQLKYDQLLEAFDATGYEIVNIDSIVFEMLNGAEVREYQDDGVPYLRIGDLKYLDIDPDSVVCIDPQSAEKGLNKIVLLEGDVLLSRSGSLAVSAVIDSNWTHALISSHLIRLRIQDTRFDPYFLALFLSIAPGKMQIQQWSNGGVQPEINQPALKGIYVPVVPKNTQLQIRKLILKAKELRNESKRLLEVAKRAVEVAIEQDEAAGMAYLKANGSAA